ncbi:hypothetical protein [Pseudoalteromonas piscicida]|uniref:hypothetical protein n=1 Tax=Pseudoalteromonas piscicida TaxID=43662 RepID=UPI003C7EBBAC
MSHTLPTKTNANSNFRELVFEGYASDKEVVSLMLKDTSVDGTKEGYYKVPLYTSNTVDQQSSDADIELVHIYPFLYDTPEQQLQSASPVTNGFIYIYVDGYLWRELQVIEPEDFDAPALFSDVNLYWQKGFLSWKKSANKPNSRPQGTRAATCKPISSILVPHKLNGNEVSVEIAWSEVQWSWEQILLFGGFNEQDPRLNTGTPLADEERHCPAPEDAAALRAQRMTKLDNLGQFATGYNDQGKVVNTPTLHQKLHLPERDKIAQVPIFDGIHVARYFISQIQDLTTDIQHLLNKLSGLDSATGKIDLQQQAKYELASFMVQVFYHQADSILDKDIEIQGSGETLVESDEDAVDFANKLKDWRTSHLEEDKFFKFLEEKAFQKLARRIAEISDELVEFLNQESLSAGFTECFKDYAYQSDLRFFEAYDLVTDVFLALKPHPAAPLAHLNTDKEFWHELSSGYQGQDFILQCLGQHPTKPAKQITQFLFPKPTGDKLHDYEKAEYDRFALPLTSAKIQKIHAQEAILPQEESEQMGRRLSQVIMGLAGSLFEIPEAAYNLSTHPGTLGEQKAQTREAMDATQHEIAQSEQALINAEREKAKAFKELQEKRAEYEYKKSVLENLTEQEHGMSRAQLDQQLELERARLRELEAKFAKAKVAVSRSRKQVNSFVKVNNAWKKYPFAKLIDAKADVLQPLMRLVDISAPGYLVEVEMRVQDYLNGDFPEGYMPLDPQSRKLAAEKQIKELSQIIRGSNKRKIDVGYRGSKLKLSLEDVLNLNKRLEFLTQSLNQAETITTIESKNKSIAYLIKITGADVSAKSAESTAQAIYDTAVEEAKQYATELDNQHATLKKLSDRLANLQKWQNAAVTESVSGQSLKGGMAGILGIVYIFEVANFRQAFLNWDMSGDRKLVDFMGSIADLAAIHFSTLSMVTEMKVGLPSLRQYQEFQQYKMAKGNLSAVRKFGPEFAKKTNIITWTARLNLLASAYSAGLSGFDAYYAFKRGDSGGAAGLSIATAGFVALAVETAPTILATITRGVILNPMSKLGYVGLILVLLGYGIYYLLRDEPLEAWIKACPWGSDAYGGGERDWFGDNPYYCWKTNPEYALHSLYDQLFSPKIVSDVSVVQLHTPSRIYDKVTSKGKFQVAKFNVQIPGHIPESELGYLDIQLDIRPLLAGKPWSSLIAVAPTGQAQTALDYFWQNTNIFVNSSLTGLIIEFEESALYPYFDKFNHSKIQIRMRCRKYPRGKGATIYSGSSQELKLPASERDEEGKIEKPDLWAEQVINVEIEDYGMSPAGVLQRLLN